MQFLSSISRVVGSKQIFDSAILCPCSFKLDNAMAGYAGLKSPLKQQRIGREHQNSLRGKVLPQLCASVPSHQQKAPPCDYHDYNNSTTLTTFYCLQQPWGKWNQKTLLDRSCPLPSACRHHARHGWPGWPLPSMAELQEFSGFDQCHPHFLRFRR